MNDNVPRPAPARARPAVLFFSATCNLPTLAGKLDDWRQFVDGPARTHLGSPNTTTMVAVLADTGTARTHGSATGRSSWHTCCSSRDSTGAGRRCSLAL